MTYLAQIGVVERLDGLATMKHARLVMTNAQLNEMLEHVSREAPLEACGLLGGPQGRVMRVYPTANRLRSRVAYEMHPEEQVRVMMEIEALGWDVCGIFHSHPAGPAVPSATDVAEAYYPDAVYVIFSPRAPDGWQARGFQIVAGQVTEAALLVAE